MKNLITTALLLTITLNSYSQVHIVYKKDPMDDKEYYYPSSKRIAVINQDQTKAIFIAAFVDRVDGEVILQHLDVETVGIGSCVEKDELIILFEDDTKLKLISWNNFNCEGNSYFSLSQTDIVSLSSKKVKKVKFTNGRTFDNLTGDIAVEKQSYFIDVCFALKNKNIKQVKQ